MERFAPFGNPDLFRVSLKPLGYKLQFQIVDFPNGVPGDVGITLKWG